MNRILLILLGKVFLFLAIVGGTLQYSKAWDHGIFHTPFSELPTKEKVIALTFDDGPSRARTPGLLELLAKYEVKATFFMLGEAIEREPEIAKQVFEEGHLIGNHSYNHPVLVGKSPGFVRDQIERTDQLILELGQAEVNYFRPPFSAKYIVLPLLLNSMNKELVTGTYDPPAEYKSPFPAEKVAQQVIENAQPGTIVYLHDGKSSDPEAFLEAVERIIQELKSQGYKFVRLDATLP